MFYKDGKIDPRLTILKMFTINIATINDAEIVLELITKLENHQKIEMLLTIDDIRKILSNNDSAVIILLKKNNIVIGFAAYKQQSSMFSWSESIFIYNLFIKEEYRGNEYAKLLYSYICKEAIKHDCKEVVGCSLNWNKPINKLRSKINSKLIEDWSFYKLDEDAIKKLADL